MKNGVLRRLGDKRGNAQQHRNDKQEREAVRQRGSFIMRDRQELEGADLKKLWRDSL